MAPRHLSRLFAVLVFSVLCRGGSGQDHCRRAVGNMGLDDFINSLLHTPLQRCNVNDCVPQRSIFRGTRCVFDERLDPALAMWGDLRQKNECCYPSESIPHVGIGRRDYATRQATIASQVETRDSFCRTRFHYDRDQQLCIITATGRPADRHQPQRASPLTLQPVQHRAGRSLIARLGRRNPNPDIQRVISFADTHGDMNAIVDVLILTGLISSLERTEHGGIKKLQWTDEPAGSVVVVQTGDILDKGRDTFKSIELVMYATEKAKSHGHEWRQLYGNHEIMNLQRDPDFGAMFNGNVRANPIKLDDQFDFHSALDPKWDDRFSRPYKGPTTYRDDKIRIRETMLSMDAPWGKWLRTYPDLITVVGDNAYMHAEISSPELIAYVQHIGVAAFNDLYRQECLLHNVYEPLEAPEHPICSLVSGRYNPEHQTESEDYSPVWARCVGKTLPGGRNCPNPETSCDSLSRGVASLGATRLIGGHDGDTELPLVAQPCRDLSYLMADVGMSEFFQTAHRPSLRRAAIEVLLEKATQQTIRITAIYCGYEQILYDRDEPQVVNSDPVPSAGNAAPADTLCNANAPLQ